jgi:hypothetical protein
VPTLAIHDPSARARDEHAYPSHLFANIPFFDKPFILLSAVRDLGKLSIHTYLNSTALRRDYIRDTADSHRCYHPCF